jgi:methionyl-tRNA formyltransferase
MINNTKKLNVALFGNTGMGNYVMNGLLLNENINLNCIFTNKYHNEYPYYKIQELYMESQHKEIPTYFINVNTNDALSILIEQNIEIIIVASFSTIIRKNIIDFPKIGIFNFHPSLLPKYRGSMPIHAALLNNDELLGLSIHYLTEKIDSGNILMQKSIRNDKHLNLSQILMKLNQLSMNMITPFVELIMKTNKPIGIAQDEKMSSVCKKNKGINIVYRNDTEQTIANKIRLFGIHPGIHLEGNLNVLKIKELNQKMTYEKLFKILMQSQ